MIQLSQDIVSTLCETKNLLALSGGVDSTALFFILHDNNIPFDVAHINYNMRENSKNEMVYVQNLAKAFGKICHTKQTHFKQLNNFEAKARAIRYDFFEEVIISKKL